MGRELYHSRESFQFFVVLDVPIYIALFVERSNNRAIFHASEGKRVYEGEPVKIGLRLRLDLPLKQAR